MITNPDYKGEWSPDKIHNPEYKGPWEHPMIPNPEYKKVVNRLPINYVGFDIWQVKAGTLFGNIILADDQEDIEPFLWDIEKFRAEKAAKKAFDTGDVPRWDKKDETEQDDEEESDMVELSEDVEATEENGVAHEEL